MGAIPLALLKKGDINAYAIFSPEIVEEIQKYYSEDICGFRSQTVKTLKRPPRQKKFQGNIVRVMKNKSTCKKDNVHQYKSSKKNLKKLVADYEKSEKRKKAEEELRFYAEKTSFPEVVRLAAEAKGPWNGIHPHQKRVGAEKLLEFAKKLLEALPKLKKNFEELYNAVEARKVKGVGELTVYDTALRIGGYRKIEPEKVYLHCGAKEGAKNLGVGKGERTISVDKFPSALHKLKPYEIEDFLCIYKDRLRTSFSKK